MNSQSQSSSTLNNYVPQQHHNQKNSDSSCSQCQHANIQNHQQSQSQLTSQQSSSSHDDGELVGPLHNHIVTHTRQLQKTLELLQLQVQKLKQLNKTKDSVIEQLKIQIKKYSATQLQQNIRRQSIQIKNLKHQLDMKSSMQSSNSLSSKNKHQKKLKGNIQVIYQEKQKQPTYKNYQNINKKKKVPIKLSKQSIQDFSDEQQQDSLLEKYKVNNKLPQKITKQTQEMLKSAYQNQHKQKERIFFEKQNCYRQNLQRLQKHIKICEQEMVWMTNFILGFLRMGQKLSFNFNQKIIYNNWSLRKKTKSVWRYIKHVLYHFMQIEGPNSNQNH